MEKIKDNILDNRYSLLSKIGSGTYGIIYTVKDILENNEKEYVAKIYKVFNEVDKEIEILNIVKVMHNPFIIEIINSGKGVIKRNGKIFEDKKYCILEYASKKDLLKYIDFPGKLEERYSKVIFEKILKAVKAIHSKGIYHLDIKLENIILDEKFEPKIIDFGTAKKKIENKNGFFKGRVGTIEYMPPQMFLLDKKYNPIKADIFSLGVVMFNLVVGFTGFLRATEYDEYYCYIKENTVNSKEKYWEKVEAKHNISPSELFKELYIKMVSFDEEKRPTIDEILEDKWFDEIKNLNDEERNKLEQEVYYEFEKREKIVEENNRMTITNDTIEENFDEIF